MIALVVAGLYFARVILIPLALAVLLAFLLAPLVHRMTRRGVWRVPSVLLVVLFSFVLIGVTGAVLVSQLTDLAHKLPEYQQNVHQKLDSIRNSGGGLVTRVSRLAHGITSESVPTQPRAQSSEENEKAGAERPGQPAKSQKANPAALELKPSSFSPMETVQKLLGSLISALMTAVIVIVFVIFMLIQEQGLRDRVIRLAGAGRVNLTTQVLDDAAARVSGIC
jgi:predicted PurR-regulated permease PerM